MTIQQYEQRGNGAVAVPDAAPVEHTKQVTDLVQWAAQADAAYRIAENIVDTAFCPQQYRSKPYEAAAAMMAGSELGFSPMASLRTFDHIQGVTTPKAMTQRAVVQAHGHSIWTVESTASRCVVRGQRKNSENVVESVWTIERAQQMQLTTKDQWKKQPQAMLVARATAECARLVASDALLGIPYSSEELRDDSSLAQLDPDEQAGLPAPRSAKRGGTSVSAADLTGDETIEPEPAAKMAKFSAAKTKKAIAAATSRDDLTAIYQDIPAESFTAELRDAFSARAQELAQPEPAGDLTGPDPADDPQEYLDETWPAVKTPGGER